MKNEFEELSLAEIGELIGTATYEMCQAYAYENNDFKQRAGNAFAGGLDERAKWWRELGTEFEDKAKHLRRTVHAPAMARRNALMAELACREKKETT